MLSLETYTDLIGVPCDAGAGQPLLLKTGRYTVQMLTLSGLARNASVQVALASLWEAVRMFHATKKTGYGWEPF